MSKEQICECVETLNQSRLALLDQLDSLNEDKLTHKPTPEEWSVLGIAQHLMLSERFMLNHLPEPETLKPQKASLKSYMMYPIATFVLNRDISVPAAAQVTPDDSITASELRTKWDESQTWLKAFVEQKDNGDVVQALLNHPFMVPLPTLKFVQFMQTHFNYHNRQIQKRIPSST